MCGMLPFSTNVEENHEAAGIHQTFLARDDRLVPGHDGSTDGPGSVGDHADAVLTIPSRINTSSPITIQPCNASRRGPVTFSSLELMALARG